MERIQTINPARILWCCQEQGITPEELASKTGIAWTSFKKMMDGEDGITFNQLRAVSEHFNRGTLFFLESEAIVAEEVHSPQFRTIANQKPELSAKLRALIRRVETQREIYLSLLEDLGDSEISRFSPPMLPRQNISRAAAITRQWLELGESNSFDTYRQSVESKGVLVFRSNGYNGPWQIPKESPICGFTLYDPACPVIVIKKQDNENRQAFTLIHELGHVLLHQDSFIDEEIDLFSYHGKEREANAFAGYLLVPDNVLERIVDRNRPEEVAYYDSWLNEYRKDWGISGEVILRRLLDSGRLDQTKYDAYRSWKRAQSRPESEGGNRSSRYREPERVFGAGFVRTVLDALHAKHISLAKASTYLDNLKIADVHQLEGMYAGL